MSLLERIEAPAGEEDIEPGKRTIRAGDDRGISLAERMGYRLHRLAWKTPFHSLRLRGRYPLKLLAVPKDPIAGDKAAGAEIMRGTISHGGSSVSLEDINFGDPALPAHLSDNVQSFAWLRDLAAAATREHAAGVAEHAVRSWISQCGGAVDERGWRADLWGRRIFFWSAYAP